MNPQSTQTFHTWGQGSLAEAAGRTPRSQMRDTMGIIVELEVARQACHGDAATFIHSRLQLGGGLQLVALFL